MNPYKAAEKIGAAAGQEYAVLSYFLHDRPAPSPYAVGATAAPDDGAGVWMFVRAFATARDAIACAHELVDRIKLRSVAVVPACSWRPLTTTVRVDQTTHSPVVLDQTLAELYRADIAPFKPGYQVRDGARAGHMLDPRAAEGTLARASAAAYDIVRSERELEDLRTAQRDVTLRKARAEARVQEALRDASQATWEAAEAPVVSDIVGPVVWGKMRETVAALVPSAAQQISWGTLMATDSAQQTAALPVLLPPPPPRPPSPPLASVPRAVSGPTVEAFDDDDDGIEREKRPRVQQKDDDERTRKKPSLPESLEELLAGGDGFALPPIPRPG